MLTGICKFEQDVCQEFVLLGRQFVNRTSVFTMEFARSKFVSMKVEKTINTVFNDHPEICFDQQVICTSDKATWIVNFDKFSTE